MQTYADYAEALAAKEAAGDDMIVSGIWKKRAKPTKLAELRASPPDLFFLVPSDADDDLMRAASYEAMHGEPMPDQERAYQQFLAAEAAK